MRIFANQIGDLRGRIIRLCVPAIVALFLTGCKTWNYTLHHRGLYTIAFNPTNLPIENIDLDSLRATAKNSFGPDEQPAVVIVGYNEKSELKLLSLDTGKIVDTELAYFSTPISITVKPLDIRQTGNYEVYFHEWFEPRKSFDFSVTRTPVTFAKTNIQSPALEIPPITLWLRPKDVSKNYDRVFIAAIRQQWYKLLYNAHTPRPHGVVTLEFHLTEKGQITDMKVSKNNINEQSAAICEKAILNLAPYRPGRRKCAGKWPGIIGASNSVFTVTEIVPDWFQN